MRVCIEPRTYLDELPTVGGAPVGNGSPRFFFTAGVCRSFPCFPPGLAIRSAELRITRYRADLIGNARTSSALLHRLVTNFVNEDVESRDNYGRFGDDPLLWRDAALRHVRSSNLLDDAQ